MTAAPQPLALPARALSIGAHPDDAEFGAGGTLAHWSAAGCEVTMLVVTDGSKGTWDPALTPEQLVAARHAEQRAAADELGATEVVMLGVRGRRTRTLDRAPAASSAAWIRRLRPDVVLTHDPWKRYMLHPDHRVTGFATVDAVVAARDHLFFPEQLTGGVEKHRPGALLLWAADEPDYFEDIAATFDRKLTALLRHSSQTQTTMGDALTSDVARRAFEDRIREWAAQQGEPAGLPLAESFKRLTP